ncbi:MAG: hypothetical protein FJZ90_01070 [Chloroflexi bacterium]|nr:hypothetical protein [Chloroflexota bacterium]
MAVTALALAAALGVASLPVSSSGPLYTEQERFGFAFVLDVEKPGGVVERQWLGAYHIAPLKMGWYSDWSFSADPAMPADAQLDYVQLIEVAVWEPNWAAIQQAVVNRPGSVWIIGNEPECPNQGNMTPETYAQRYQQTYERIKGWDSTARVAIGSVVEPTPLRKMWLEQVLAAYKAADGGQPMPIDVWTVHIQILHEGSVNQAGDAFVSRNDGAGVPVGIDDGTALLKRRAYTLPDNANPDILKTMVLDFREWMKGWGYQDRELIISEMGVLFPSTYLVPEDQGQGLTEEEKQLLGDLRLERFIVESAEWLFSATSATYGYPADEHRLVQRWLWYSLNGHYFWEDRGEGERLWGYNGSLYNHDTKAPTRFGHALIAYRNRAQRTNRLYLPRLSR